MVFHWANCTASCSTQQDREAGCQLSKHSPSFCPAEDNRARTLASSLIVMKLSHLIGFKSQRGRQGRDLSTRQHCAFLTLQQSTSLVSQVANVNLSHSTTYSLLTQARVGGTVQVEKQLCLIVGRQNSGA